MSTSSNQSVEVSNGKGGTQLEKLKKLKCVYNANWKIQALRCGFLHQLDNLIRNWKGRRPNLSNIFRNEEMNYFLEDYLNSCRGSDIDPTERFINFSNRRGDNDISQGERFIDFLVHSGYKYEPGADKGGKPLSIAIKKGHENWIERLLRIGADPNCVNEDGETALHIIIHKENIHPKFLEKFFKIIDDEQLTLQIDAKDNLGRTPLQWAVARFAPTTVGILLDHGADLSNFVFPTSSYFGQICSHLLSYPYIFTEIHPVFEILAVVQQLETRGYELDPSGAMTIMTFFSDHRWFAKSEERECWDHDEEFASKTKDLMIKPDLSLHDLAQLRPKEAAKLINHRDYMNLYILKEFRELPERYMKAYVAYLREIISRRFFLPWALDPFMELIHYRLPILCCDMIIENLGNEDLYKICLTATSKSS